MSKKIIEELISTLKECFRTNGLDENEVIKQIEFAHDGSYFNSMLMHDKNSFMYAVKALIQNKNMKKIVIYPCNTYLENIIEVFKEYELFYVMIIKRVRHLMDMKFILLILLIGKNLI